MKIVLIKFSSTTMQGKKKLWECHTRNFYYKNEFTYIFHTFMIKNGFANKSESDEFKFENCRSPTITDRNGVHRGCTTYFRSSVGIKKKQTFTFPDKK